MQADTAQLNNLKALLISFAASSGLKVNFDKSLMLPVNLSATRLDELAANFGCSKGTLPFAYLGLPLNLTKPSVADFWPLVSKCERRLATFFNFLSDAGRLQMTNAVLTAFPTYTMCTYLLPKTVTKQIDKFRKHCLWRGSDANNRKPPKSSLANGTCAKDRRRVECHQFQSSE